MSEFIVSARKYRPQTFRSVVGQRHITETLRNAIAKNQMAHAYLFTGPRGVGKTTCARIFARAINCLNPTEDHEACGVCESCVAFAADRSFNIHEMDAASNNSVDDIRALNDKVRVAPQVGKYSVYIIDEVHMLSASAFNAFLKTLEEPPAHAIFVLATTEKHKILPTILSRCQIYDFNRIKSADIVDYLQYIASKEGVTYDDESLTIIAKAADGGMRDALSTFDRVVSFCGEQLKYSEVAECVGALDYNTYFSCVEMAMAGDYGSLLVLFDTILNKGFDGGQFLGGLAEHLRQLLVAKNPQTASLLELSGSVAERYKAQTASMDVQFLFSAINLVSQADSSYRAATSRRLHVELTIMKLSGLGVSLGGKAPEIVRAALPKIENNQNPAPQIQQPQPVVPQPQVQPQPQPQVAPQPQVQQQVVQQQVPEVQQTVPVPPAPQSEPPKPAQGGSLLGFSINTPRQEVATEEVTRPNVEMLDHDSGVAELRARFSELINLWNNRNKPRMAMVLSTAIIDDDKITVFVPGDVMEEEILNSRVEIEGDMIRLFKFRLPIEVILREETRIERPVTLQQRVDHLVAKNPKVLKLTEALDLTM